MSMNVLPAMRFDVGTIDRSRSGTGVPCSSAGWYLSMGFAVTSVSCFQVAIDPSTVARVDHLRLFMVLDSSHQPISFSDLLYHSPM